MIHSHGPDASYGNIQASCDTQDLPNSIAPVTLHGTDISRTPSQVHTRREWTAYELYAFVLERQTLMGINGHPIPTSLWGMNIDSRNCPVSHRTLGQMVVHIDDLAPAEQHDSTVQRAKCQAVDWPGKDGGIWHSDRRSP